MISISEASKKYNLSKNQIENLIGIVLLRNAVSKSNTLYIHDDDLKEYLLSHPSFYKTCLHYPSDDYITHSFSNRLCNHIDNESKLCMVGKCPLINLEKRIE